MSNCSPFLHQAMSSSSTSLTSCDLDEQTACAIWLLASRRSPTKPRGCREAKHQLQLLSGVSNDLITSLYQLLSSIPPLLPSTNQKRNRQRAIYAHTDRASGRAGEPPSSKKAGVRRKQGKLARQWQRAASRRKHVLTPSLQAVASSPSLRRRSLFAVQLVGTVPVGTESTAPCFRRDDCKTQATVDSFIGH